MFSSLETAFLLNSPQNRHELSLDEINSFILKLEDQKRKGLKEKGRDQSSANMAQLRGRKKFRRGSAHWQKGPHVTAIDARNLAMNPLTVLWMQDYSSLSLVERSLLTKATLAITLSNIILTARHTHRTMAMALLEATFVEEITSEVEETVVEEITSEVEATFVEEITSEVEAASREVITKDKGSHEVEIITTELDRIQEVMVSNISRLRIWQKQTQSRRSKILRIDNTSSKAR